MGARTGTVYLVGAGPGHPELITVGGLKLLRHADAVVYDRLISSDLLSHARHDAERIGVGKAPGAHAVSQEEINRILVDRARRGLCVVRLKGGDPFIFGRGFEELTACREANVPCVVIPGVSSAFAVPAAAGIPVTLREHVRSVAMVTGSVSAEAEPPPLDFEALASMDTLIVLMGLAPLAGLTQALIDAGRDPDTPAATIERGTLPDQRVVRATLATIADAVSKAELRAPVISVIGEVARYAQQSHGGAALGRATQAPGIIHALSAGAGCYSKLVGKCVVLTRPPSRSGKLRRALKRLGATVVECPMIEIGFPDRSPDGDQAVRRLAEYSWVVFTSVNSVRGFWRRVRAADLDARALGGCRIAAVGPATARALRHVGLFADLVPEQHNAAALVDVIVNVERQHSHGHEDRAERDSAAANLDDRPTVLFPCGDRALDTIENGLARHGFRVDRVVVYQTRDAAMKPERLKQVVQGADFIVFHSPTAVQNYSRLGGPTTVRAICIGQTTAQAARQWAFTAIGVAQRADAEGLIAAAESAV